MTDLALSATVDDVDFWTVVVGANTFLLYVCALLAIGTALFQLALSLPSGDVKRLSFRLGFVAAMVAAVSFTLTIGLGGGNMIGEGVETLLSANTWSIAAGTTLGLSAALGVAGMVFLCIGFRKIAIFSNIALAAGSLLGIGGFLVTGHAATASPRWLMTPIIAIHLVAAAFWFGALFPLLRVALAGPGSDAVGLIRRFSSRAVVVVFVLVASGIMTTIVQIQKVEALTQTSYGIRLLFKLGAFALLLTFAAYNKFSLTPRFQRGGCAAEIRRSIILEQVLFFIILAAAASLTLVAPPRE
jgi:copper transport protein